MNTKYLIYSLFILVALMAVSCDKYLERDSLDNVTDATFFKNETDIKQFTDGFYGGFTPGTRTIFFDYCTDFIGHNPSKIGNRFYPDLIYSSYTPTSETVNTFWDFSSIRRAYILLEKINDVDMSDDSRNLYLGITHYLLAYRNFVLFRAYENAPIVREVLDVSKSDIPTSPKEEVFQEALSHIDEAISKLPSLEPDKRERGRLTKLVALTLKADMLLYASTRYKEAITVATYKAAADAADAAIKEADTKGYGLADNYQKLFISAYQAEADPQREIIFEYVRLKDVATDDFCTGYYAPRHDDLGYGDFSTSQEVIDMHECTDGLPINKSNLYDPEHPFKNRDPRLELTTLFPGNITSYIDGDPWISNTLDPSPDNHDYMLSNYNPLDRPPSGYINIKYWDRQRKGKSGYASFIAYRYAELLLMFAEASNEANGPSTAVYDALSKLRDREGVNMPAVNSTTHPTREDVRRLIRNERAVELFGEGKRYWDIRRWGIGEQVINKSFYSMHISKFKSDGSFDHYVDKIYVRTSLTDPSQEELFEIPDGATGGRLLINGVFNNEKFYVWPIPQSAINASNSGALKQHPLWAN